MKTEDLLRYQAEYRAMQEALGTFLLVFDFSRGEGREVTIFPLTLTLSPKTGGEGIHAKRSLCDE
jgi:hypothetical protein